MFILCITILELNTNVGNFILNSFVYVWDILS